MSRNDNPVVIFSTLYIRSSNIALLPPNSLLGIATIIYFFLRCIILDSLCVNHNRIRLTRILYFPRLGPKRPIELFEFLKKRPPYFSSAILLPPPLYPVPTVNLLRKERTTPWVPWHAETRVEFERLYDIHTVSKTQSAIYHCLSHLGKKYTSYVPIHRGALLHDYFQIQIHEDELQSSILIDETFSGLAMNFFFASLCKSDCSTLTALSIMFMVICSRPFLPPLFPRQFP